MSRAERRTARRELAYAARDPKPVEEAPVAKAPPEPKPVRKSTAKKK